MVSTPTTPTTVPQDDPYASAMDATWESNPHVFGEVSTNVWHCVLERGTGKVQYDQLQHDPDARRTAIEITITPLNPNFNPVNREMIAESREWATIVKPSLVALDTDLRGVTGRFVQAQLVPTGRTYESGGETRQATTVKFLKVFASEDECRAAFEARRGPRSGGQAAQPAATAPAPASPPAAGQVNQEAALKFVPALVRASGGDPVKLEALLKANALTSWLTIDHPAVLAEIEKAAGAGAGQSA